ncbi:24547_t:CDS:2 [Gigaspora rosea]|nr:24547_t:CDS:2 [Gigaspora rosea]
MNALFSSQQAYITDLGFLSEPFRVERGIKNQYFKIVLYTNDLTISIGSQSD